MNAATDSTKLYVDGILRGVSREPIGSLTTGGVGIPLEVGRHFRTGWGTPDYYFPGALDEVRIYDEELSAAAVAHLFTNNALAAVEQDRPRGLSIEGSWPNPSRGGRLVVSFALPAAGPAQLAMFDISGRLVSKLPLGTLGAGPHEAEFSASRGLPPGMYMLQLKQGAHTSMRRVTVLE